MKAFKISGLFIGLFLFVSNMSYANELPLFKNYKYGTLKADYDINKYTDIKKYNEDYIKSFTDNALVEGGVLFGKEVEIVHQFLGEELISITVLGAINPQSFQSALKSLGEQFVLVQLNSDQGVFDYIATLNEAKSLEAANNKLNSFEKNALNSSPSLTYVFVDKFDTSKLEKKPNSVQNLFKQLPKEIRAVEFSITREIFRLSFTYPALTVEKIKSSVKKESF